MSRNSRPKVSIVTKIAVTLAVVGVLIWGVANISHRIVGIPIGSVERVREFDRRMVEKIEKEKQSVHQKKN